VERYDAARRIIEDAVDAGEIPGAVAVAGGTRTWQTLTATGVRRYASGANDPPAVTPDTVYDLASLTKVVATLPAILKLIAARELTLDDPVKRFFSNAGWFQTPTIADATVRQLLTHTSGLPAWKPLFALTSTRETALANVLQSALEHPPGQYVYSDLGFILLGALVERVSGLRQDVFVAREIFEPLGMNDTRYGPVSGVPVAATENCGWRNRLLEGEVHDENGYVMSGVAGHAGLFGTADDLARYAHAWLTFDPRLGSEDLLRRAVDVHVEQEGIRRALGWMLQGQGASAGAVASSRAFGHTGFTGTSLWCDPEQEWFAVLLTNRVHPSRTRGHAIQGLRSAFHEAVADACVQ
jgi:CubicO group peptidase (beta-lactamase class C family)